MSEKRSGCVCLVADLPGEDCASCLAAAGERPYEITLDEDEVHDR